MRRVVIVTALMGFIVALGLWWNGRTTTSQQPPGELSVVQALTGDAGGFMRVTSPRVFTFPADHGSHPDYQTEWWYYTGNLNSADGRHWGYQLTFFRRGLTPDPSTRPSTWATSQIYTAHFALTDVSGKHFSAYDRTARAAAGLAGATATPYHVWTESWSATGRGNTMHLAAAQEGNVIDLDLDLSQPPALQGKDGVSQKSEDLGNASYYYSIPRMETTGTIRSGDETVTVTGQSWMDREWSTSSLAPTTVGWDWFALQLSDGRELMYYQLRRRDGGIERASAGSLIGADGSVQPLSHDDLTLEVLDHWRSPRSGIQYPSGWRVRVVRAGIDLQVRPYIPNQELPLSFVYWEGACRLAGTSAGISVTGDGYVELTGYGDQSLPATVGGGGTGQAR